MKSKRMCGISLVVLSLLVLPVAAAAVLPPPLAGLDVTLYQEDVALGSDVTDARGHFRINDIAAGVYELSIEDAAGGLSFRWSLEVTEDDAPAAVTGKVLAGEDGIRVAANVRTGVLFGGCVVDGVALAPRVWSPSWKPDRTQVRVVMSGSDLAAITSVSLRTTEGEVVSTTFTYNRYGYLVALFPGAETYQALVPDAAVAGDTVPVEVVVYSGDASLTYERAITIGPGKE